LRFGRAPLNSYKKWLKQYRYRQQLQVRRLSLLIPINAIIPSNKFHIYIPNHWATFLLGSKKSSCRNKLLYLSSSKYFFKIPLVTDLMLFNFDSLTRSVNILLLSATSLIHLYLKTLQKLLYMFSQVQFVRMKFRGKGYYIYKTLRHTIAPNFGYAHRVYVYAYFVSLKFLSKTSIILFGLLKTDLFKVGDNFKSTRPINIFTGRGVRFTRQIIYKKTGKVSSYR
jgi:hypothetical protein